MIKTNVNNSAILGGQLDGPDEPNVGRPDIFKWDVETNSMILVGRMRDPRVFHAVSEIDFSEVAEYCEEGNDSEEYYYYYD